MRLWHYKLLPVLPNTMLVSQWRECIAIKKQWEKGTLNHRLVSYIMNYEKPYFNCYVNHVVMQMIGRNIKFQKKYYDEIVEFCDSDPDFCEYYFEHNDRYLKQCYYNLQEKYDRGIITEEEWQKIQKIECLIKKEGRV